jgi:serine phosphatase RsbU (regulator of sigma subunit)
LKTPQTDDLARGNHVVPTEWAEQLERERDEARERSKMMDIKIAQQEAITELVLENQRLKRERDEAREQYDDLATEHMLAVNKICNERDEAREERDNFKQELEIVTARLHGKKHPLDNGIPERHEVYIWKNGKYELDP